MASTVLFARGGGQVISSNQEPPAFYAGECQEFIRNQKQKKGQKAVRPMSKIYLFTDTETANWNRSQFDALAAFCKAHHINGVVLKIYEKTQGEWYSNLGGATTVIKWLQADGMEVMPFGYYYGASNEELASIQLYLARYGTYCMQMEAEWNGAPQPQLTNLVTAIKGHVGKLWVSTWADPATQNWLGVISALNPYVDTWLPQIYDPNLVPLFSKEFPHVLGNIYPTYQILNVPPLSSLIKADIITLWEYQQALAHPDLLDAVVKEVDPPPIDYVRVAANIIWNSTATGSPIGTGIYNLWYADYKQGIFRGPPLTPEFPYINWQGYSNMVAQAFPSGQYEWDLATNIGHFYPYK